MKRRTFLKTAGLSSFCLPQLLTCTKKMPGYILTQRINVSPILKLKEVIERLDIRLAIFLEKILKKSLVVEVNGIPG